MPTKRDTKKSHGRLGRPPKDLAGDVKARILEAARQVFLERGYQSASIDEIAEVAPASKPTIYAHFPGKEALFDAVVTHVINGLANFEGYAPKGRTYAGQAHRSRHRTRGKIYRGHSRRNSCDDCRSRIDSPR